MAKFLYWFCQADDNPCAEAHQSADLLPVLACVHLHVVAVETCVHLHVVAVETCVHLHVVAVETCVHLHVVAVGCLGVSKHPQLDSKLHGFVLHELFEAKATFERHHGFINSDVSVWHILFHETISDVVENVAHLVQFVTAINRCAGVDKV